MIYILIAAGVFLLMMIAAQAVSSFHLLTYQNQSGATNTSTDLTANVDGEFSQRNGHYLLSEPYNLLGVAIFGTGITEGNLLSPSINAITKFNVNPLNLSEISQSPPRMDYWTHYPVPLPMNEEIQVSVSGGGSASMPLTAMLVIAPPEWTPKIPVGMPPIPVFEMRFTASVVLNNNQWSTLQNMTFEQSLRGGTYYVVGGEFIGTGLLAARIVFPQAPFIRNRRMRPGSIASNAIGDQTLAVGQVGPLLWGAWGQFTTAELPFIECLGGGTATITVTGLLRLVRLSESINVSY